MFLVGPFQLSIFYDSTIPYPYQTELHSGPVMLMEHFHGSQRTFNQAFISCRFHIKSQLDFLNRCTSVTVYIIPAEVWLWYTHIK